MISLALSLIGHHPWYIKTTYPHNHYSMTPILTLIIIWVPAYTHNMPLICKQLSS